MESIELPPPPPPPAEISNSSPCPPGKHKPWQLWLVPVFLVLSLAIGSLLGLYLRQQHKSTVMSGQIEVVSEPSD